MARLLKFSGKPKKPGYLWTPPVIEAAMAALDGNMGNLKQLVFDGEKIKEEFAGFHGGLNRRILHFAAAGGNMQILNFLLEDLKLHSDLKDSMVRTPLQYAVMAGNYNASEYLLNRGASVNAACENGETSLHAAAGRGYHKIASLLISRGADLEAKSNLATALNIAAETGNHEVIKVLLNNHADANANFLFVVPPLVRCVLNNSVECVKMLLEAGACPNIRSCCGLRPLEAVIWVGATGMFELLLKAGADPNIKNNYGMTPVEVAALMKKHRIVELLLHATSPIPTVREWSVHGITEHVLSEAAVEQRILKGKERCMLSKEKAEDAFKRADYLEAVFWFSEASVADPSDAAVLSRRDLCWAHLEEDGISVHLDDGKTPHMEMKAMVTVAVV